MAPEPLADRFLCFWTLTITGARLHPGAGRRCISWGIGLLTFHTGVEACGLLLQNI